MAIKQVALIFDDRLRPDTTGVYVRRALAGLVQVVHFQPEQADRIPEVGFDLYLSIDDDTPHHLPGRLRPWAFWAIDTHRDFAARLARSRSCDLVFAAQRDGAERLRAAGIDSAIWLPLACDPAIHRPHEVPRQYDVGFVGHSGPGPRGELLELIRRQFPDHFIGRAYFDEMARIYSASRIVFNRSITNDVNMRVFEAAACGSLLVTNDLAENGQEELFRDGVHLVTYREPGEMVERIRYYLGHADERDAIAAAGRAEAVASHTYRHRMVRLLGSVESRLARSVAGMALVRGDVRTMGDGPRSEIFGPVEAGVGRPAPIAPPHSEEEVARPALRVPHPRARLPRRAASRSGAVPGLASIIVPCANQREFTRLCVQALVRHTAPDWELIIIDNASTDGTADYLAGLQDGGRVPVTIVRNEQDLGDPAAINQGLQLARGEHLVLLNNDVVVTEGWLDQLIALTVVRAEAEGAETLGPERVGVGRPAPNRENPTRPEGGIGVGAPLAATPIGLVGPMSNHARPPQRVDAVSYRDMAGMHAFARRWRQEHHRQWFRPARLSRFCLLMTRAAYQAIRGPEQRARLDSFDDDDLAVRVRRAGFELAVAHDLFVHRFCERP